MQQDLALGREMEIDALVAVVQELGRLTGVPASTIGRGLELRGFKAGVHGLAF